MSESDFYTVNHRYEAQGAPREWPTWELRAHGSAAPAAGPAAPGGAAGSDGRGGALPRPDPLGPWCSARLTFADGARIDVLVTVSDDHITVEDVRADPPLPLDGLADLARWIEGPLDDAFRAATGRPRKNRPAPRQPGPAAVSPEREGGPMAGPPRKPKAGPASDPVPGSAQEPVTRPAAGTATEGASASETCRTGELSADTVPEPPASAAPGPQGAAVAAPAVESAAAPTTAEPAVEPAADRAADPADAGSKGVAGEADTAGTDAAGTTAAGKEAGIGAEASVVAPSKTEASAPAKAAEERARSALLARSRAAERRKLAAEAYRQAQREGRDPVLAVMLATGRNRRRSLRLIAGARDEGLLTPRHNKR
ncbi:DUF6214 family protein [Streptomyces lydicus]|uniref:DUF6214 family protein n=1 Tax=Streptomyces lydicus TaxID=47763 RepID=UPI0037D5D584